MDSNMLLYISFIIYLIIMVIGFAFNVKWIFVIAALMWFIPLTEIDNSIIQIISAGMILFHAVLGLAKGKEDDFQ